MPVNYSVRYIHNGGVKGAISQGLQNNLKAAAVIWHGGIIKLLRGTGGGRMYYVPGTGGVRKQPITVKTKHPRYKVSSYTRNGLKRYGRQYQASAPGQPPATRLGDLRTSYRFQVKKNYAEVGSPLKYALALEKGTSRMAPRPHLKPALMQNRARIKAALERTIL